MLTVLAAISAFIVGLATGGVLCVCWLAWVAGPVVEDSEP